MNTNNHHEYPDRVTVEYGALISMHGLPERLRRHVLHVLAELTEVPPEQWPADTVHLRRKRDAVYVLDADPELRVFFKREKDGRIIVVDLVNQTNLDRYSAENAV
jgi:hypothetical protein